MRISDWSSDVCSSDLSAAVPVPRVLDHRPHRHLAQFRSVEAELLDQRAERAHRHAEVADVGIGGVLATEGNADAAEDGDGAAMQHRDYLVAGLPSWRAIME